MLGLARCHRQVAITSHAHFCRYTGARSGEIGGTSKLRATKAFLQTRNHLQIIRAATAHENRRFDAR